MPRLTGRQWAIVAGVAVVLIAGVVVAGPKLAWRAELVGMKLQGDLVGMGWDDVLQTLGPNSRYNVTLLLETGNAYRAFAPPHQSTEDAAAGGELFRASCAQCHGADARGAIGPNLVRSAYQANPRGMFQVISDGIAGTVMAGFAEELSPEERWQVVAYLADLNEKAGRDTSLVVLPAPRITYDRLLEARSEPDNWLTYSGAYDSRRHSPLDEITRENVGDLQLRWVLQTETAEPKIETTPLVVDGVMYLTAPPNNVVAVDAASGRRLWTYRRVLPEDVNVCCGRVNRGVALLGDRLFMATLDAHLVALDARTGEVVWDVVLADYRNGYSMTGAPLALKDMVITGIAGGEYGIRGFLDAYDAETGERVWRFYTVPGPGEPGHDTWEGESWRHGGAPTWITGAYDPELDLLYWGVGNPGPPWAGDDREGTNLYSNSVIALDPDNGELAWHFQFTPHDTHDWDATQIPVLVDLPFPDSLAGGWRPADTAAVGVPDPGTAGSATAGAGVVATAGSQAIAESVAPGESRPLMLWANRNGFYYVLDRETGEFLHASPFAKQTWAERITDEGVPVPTENSVPTPQGTLIYPAAFGATNWWPPSYSPETGLFYVPATVESAHIYRTRYLEADPTYEAGEPFLGSGFQEAPETEFETAVLALVPQTGEVRWRFDLPQRLPGDHGMGGLLSTAGALVFAGGSNWVFALDAATGEELWRFQTGGEVMAPAVTYAVDGVQHITIPAGRAFFTFALDRAPDE